MSIPHVYAMVTARKPSSDVIFQKKKSYRPYTPMMGQLSTVWYDRRQISPSAPDDESVDEMAAQLTALIQSEVDDGIPLNRIVVGKYCFDLLHKKQVLKICQDSKQRFAKNSSSRV